MDKLLYKIVLHEVKYKGEFMAGSLNKVTLIGNVGKDPEIRSMQDGREVASFSLATSDIWKDKASGEKREKTEWHRIVVFSQPLINLIKNYISKGSKLYVEGALQTRKWTDQQGVEKYTTEIVLQAYSGAIMMLDGKGSGGAASNDYMADNDAHRVPNSMAENQKSALHDLDDEIPF
jgi:single-strand DNA-binding protein